jgi:hypothetical protein
MNLQVEKRGPYYTGVLPRNSTINRIRYLVEYAISMRSSTSLVRGNRHATLRDATSPPSMDRVHDNEIVRVSVRDLPDSILKYFPASIFDYAV